MNRRILLVTTAATAVMGAVRSAALASPNTAQPADTPSSSIDGLNPPGIRVAGIRMLPVAGGKYKVWTKKLGSGPTKVLLLHGGPGFSHEYLEAFESFLPQAGTTISWAATTPTSPTMPRCGRSLATRPKWKR